MKIYGKQRDGDKSRPQPGYGHLAREGVEALCFYTLEEAHEL